jgi:16S rRNA (guanine527-N7)-methyltransferase
VQNPASSPEKFTVEAFAAQSGVSRETMARLKLYASLLEDWNARHNLVSRASMEELWQRHFWDSAQLLPLIPEAALTLVDLGSGAGFPGLVLAELLRERTGFRAVLYEATAKKCRFLEMVASRLGLPVDVRNRRMEREPREIFDVIVARACAPLADLAQYAEIFWGRNSIGLFLKGQNVGSELTHARKSWRIKALTHPSRSDPSGVVLEIRELRRAAG